MIGTPKKIISWLLNEDENILYQCKRYKEKRNLSQNNKYYALLNELALVLKIGIEELHRKMLKNYSVRYQVMIPSEVELRGIKYYELKGTKSKNNKLFNIYEVYVPSHELKEDEFAVLLQNLIEECKQVGIDTRSPEEVMKDEMLCDV